MLGLLDRNGAGLVRAALEPSGQELQICPDARAVTRLIGGESLRALIVECEAVDTELAELLCSTRAQGVPSLIVARERSVTAAVEALRAGASDYLAAPFELETLLGGVARLLDRAMAPPATAGAEHSFITVDPELRQTLELVRSIAASEATVLIEGESGTGKELLARLVHSASPRSAREMVSVNCAALPAGLLESELFGHERGAFTGAFSRVVGKFELAHQSTLMLDEIGELETSLQAKLLRVIQEREVQRIGAPRPTTVDFRLVATTNRRLVDEVRNERFREDLYYRLNVVPVRVTPLRERRHDIPVLIEHFLASLAQERPLPEITPAAQQVLCQYDWPGNVRELENTLERLTLVRGGQEVGIDDLGLEPIQRTGAPSLGPASSADETPPFQTIREMERWLIVDTLTRLQGNRTQAARELGISLRTLRNKINEYQVVEPGTLPSSGTAAAAHRRRQISPSAP